MASKRMSLHEMKARVVIDCKTFDKAWDLERGLKAMGVHHVHTEVGHFFCAPCAANNHGAHELAAGRGVPCDCPCSTEEAT